MKRWQIRAGPSPWFVAALLLSGASARGDGLPQRAPSLPNPFRVIENHFKLAEGRWWESTSAVDVDQDGKSIWIADRCAANSCAGSRLNPILKFDQSGALVRRFGAGMFVLPHGIHVDRDGSVWVTDARGATEDERARSPDAANKGHAVYKFSPDGRLLLTLGTPGRPGDGTGALLNEPCDVATAPNGDVFVADGHSGQHPEAPPGTVARIARFTRDGQFVTSWGSLGSRPGEFRTPHGLAFDRSGRLFVADRGNNRIQIFTQDGRFVAAWTQFGRVSGIFIDRNDVLYASDSESSEATNPGWQRGIRIGKASDGTVVYFIPDPSPDPRPDTRSGADGVTADALGNVYGAGVGAGALAMKKYQRQPP